MQLLQSHFYAAHYLYWEVIPTPNLFTIIFKGTKMQKFKILVNKSINEKKWIVGVFLCVMSFLSIAAFLNIFIDPYFLYGAPSHKYNQFYKYIDERVEKANRIYYGKKESYDSILLGSSRATFVNQYDFQEQKLFNFAAASMIPFEYKDYLDLMKQKGYVLDTIYLQIDFFGANTNYKEEAKKRYKKTFKPLNDPLNRISKLFAMSKNLTEILLENIEGIKADVYYSRDNIKYAKKLEEKDRQKRFRSGLKGHTLEFIGNAFCFDENLLRNTLTEIKNENPHSHFVIYTSPVTTALFVSQINFAKRWEEYKKYIKLYIEIFGGVYQFEGFNEITQNVQNYPDDDHFYPYIGTLITQRLTNKEYTPIKDFGIYLDSKNVENYFAKLEIQLKNYDMSEIIEIMNNEK